MNDKPTLDKHRTRHAWEAVEAVAKHVTVANGKPKPDEVAKKFGGQAKKLPMRIIAAGMGQALAFLCGKGYAPALLTDLGDWILDKRHDPESRKPKPLPDALITAIVHGTSDKLRLMTDEALAYLQWLNRFAEARGLTEGDNE